MQPLGSQRVHTRTRHHMAQWGSRQGKVQRRSHGSLLLLLLLKLLVQGLLDQRRVLGRQRRLVHLLLVLAGCWLRGQKVWRQKRRWFHRCWWWCWLRWRWSATGCNWCWLSGTSWTTSCRCGWMEMDMGVRMGMRMGVVLGGSDGLELLANLVQLAAQLATWLQCKLSFELAVEVGQIGDVSKKRGKMVPDMQNWFQTSTAGCTSLVSIEKLVRRQKLIQLWKELVQHFKNWLCHLSRLTGSLGTALVAPARPAAQPAAAAGDSWSGRKGVDDDDDGPPNCDWFWFKNDVSCNGGGGGCCCWFELDGRPAPGVIGAKTGGSWFWFWLLLKPVFMRSKSCRSVFWRSMSCLKPVFKITNNETMQNQFLTYSCPGDPLEPKNRHQKRRLQRRPLHTPWAVAKMACWRRAGGAETRQVPVAVIPVVLVQPARIIQLCNQNRLVQPNQHTLSCLISITGTCFCCCLFSRFLAKTESGTGVKTRSVLEQEFDSPRNQCRRNLQPQNLLIISNNHQT